MIQYRDPSWMRLSLATSRSLSIPARSCAASHSQIVITCQPNRRSAATDLRSRLTFAANFWFQNALFDFGL